ncbi:MAG: nitrophenyl compound nitroreductase subunit ArsF family protein [Tenuifilaceae bacterium]|nr:nitrophenyl compound nitroreductase subunit ArsF family protein [Tenuifilaceae bacterium]
MKNIVFVLALFIFAFTLISCGGSQEKQRAKSENTEIAQTAKVVVYYFHGKQRCKTCLAIQKVTEETINENFAKNADVRFMELDYSDKANEAIAQKYEVANSSLFVVAGESFINLTDVAFANAVRNPDDLKGAIVVEVEKYLNK